MPKKGQKEAIKQFHEDSKSTQKFQEDLSKFTDDVVALTPYTVNGLSIVSHFSIAVRLQMEPSFFGQIDEKEEEIPIIIRSQRDGRHIQDIM